MEALRMKVGLLADTHDRLPAMSALVALMAERGAAMLLHAGDFCAPFAIAALLGPQLPIGGVFGRNDGDRQGLLGKAAAGIGVELFESPHTFEVGGRQILLVHDIGEVQARSVESHPLVVHGCTHKRECRTRGDTLIVNPGEGCGWVYGTPSAAIVDLETNHVEFVTLDGPEWRF
jgi:putative phosphoesterase